MENTHGEGVHEHSRPRKLRSAFHPGLRERGSNLKPTVVILTEDDYASRAGYDAAQVPVLAFVCDRWNGGPW